MNTLARCSYIAMAVLTAMPAESALSDGLSGEVQGGLFSVTATLDGVVCMRCYHWNGVGDVERVADKLVATVSSPAQFAGKSINVFVWDDGRGVSQPWQPHSQLSFLTTKDMMARERVVFPRSQLLSH